MIYYLLAIALLTLILWGLYKAKAISVCPICAAVVITWVGGLAALYWRASWSNPLIVAILMGASIGALADKYGSKFGFLWKSAVVLLGLPAVYFLTQKALWPGLGLVLLLGLVTVLSHNNNPTGSHEKKDLFKNCC